jgi:hypothetical protein
LTETLRDTEGGVGVDGRSHWKSWVGIYCLKQPHLGEYFPLLQLYFPIYSAWPQYVRILIGSWWSLWSRTRTQRELPTVKISKSHRQGGARTEARHQIEYIRHIKLGSFFTKETESLIGASKDDMLQPEGSRTEALLLESRVIGLKSMFSSSAFAMLPCFLKFGGFGFIIWKF